MPSNRLPTPGSDSGNWGILLNSYLNTTLSDTGGINTCDVVYLEDTDIITTNTVILSITNNYTTKPIDFILNKKTKSLFKLTKSGTNFTLTKVNNIPHTFSIVNINTGSIFRWIEDTTTPANSDWQIISSGEVINVRDWGARGDAKLALVSGVLESSGTDDTLAIQSAVNSAPEFGRVEGKGGYVYYVSRINLKSNLYFENFNFLTIPTDQLYYSPITIGTHEATLADILKENIFIRNVHIDGNRTKQTNFPFDGAENGGRHGFRLIGNCKNIIIENCTANYCGSDGIFLYSGFKSGRINFTDISVKNCVFNYNRRHGCAIDSADGVLFENCLFNYNGLDIDINSREIDLASFDIPAGTVIVQDTNRPGHKGDTVNSKFYGNGVDAETYGADTYNNNLTFKSCKFIDNAWNGLHLYTPVDPTISGFSPNKNTRIESCDITKGVTKNNWLPNAGLQILGTYIYWTLGDLFKNISIINCDIKGELVFTQIRGLYIDGGEIVQTTRDGLGNCYYCNNVIVGAVNALNNTNSRALEIIHNGTTSSGVKYVGLQSSP